MSCSNISVDMFPIGGNLFKLRANAKLALDHSGE